MAFFDIFKKKQMPAADRYAGKPLLRLVEAFILDTIGELSPAQRAAAEQMTPKLQALYKSTSTWQGIVVEIMQWDESIGSSINAMWENNQAIARANGVTLSPSEFAILFADANVAID